MIHTLMEVDSHPHPSSSSPPRIRGPSGLSLATFRHHTTRMSKRQRSPEGADPRPSKRVAGELILATTSSSGNSSRQHSEDWVRQAGGLRIDSLAQPGPSTSNQIEEDVAMAVEEDTAHVPPFQQGGQENPSSAQPLMLPQRTLSMLNPSLSNRHPYGQHWAQQRVRNADGSLLINVVPATPADSQLSLSMTEEPIGHAVEHMLHANHAPRGSPPISDSTGMTVLTPPLAQQDSSPFVHPNLKNKRVAFGPRLNCEKCRQGEIHFAHVQYE